MIESTFDSYELIRAETGSSPVYPGHPLVLATVIMRTFPDFATANAPTPYGWPLALGDCRIPGAGDHVYAAMRCLQIGADGGSIDEMVAYARAYWTEGEAGGHTKNVEAGVAQAQAIEPKFRELAAAWPAGPAKG
jgi:hypothetical protein